MSRTVLYGIIYVIFSNLRKNMPYSTIEHINILKSCQINIFGTIVVINFYETGLFFEIVFNVRRVEILQYV